MELSAGLWSLASGVQTLCQYLCCLLLGDALDLLENSSWSVGNRLDGVVASIDNQLNVTLCQTRNTLKDTNISHVSVLCGHPDLLPARKVALVPQVLRLRYLQRLTGIPLSLR
jgi:hypothetical protein